MSSPSRLQALPQSVAIPNHRFFVDTLGEGLNAGHRPLFDGATSTLSCVPSVDAMERRPSVTPYRALFSK
jgi:hypothetical protein